MRYVKIFAPVMAMAFCLLAACNDKNNFRLEGVIEGADDASLVVERADYNGVWQPIDSTRTGGDGKFKIDVASAGVPEIYRLVLDGKYIYFPVDSTEHIRVESSLGGFGREYSLSGSEQARKFEEFDKALLRLPVTVADSVALFKKNVFNKYIKDSRGNLLGYYVLTKSVNGNLLFDPRDTSDVKYYSAVATIFKEFRPDDPRTAVLEQMALEGMKRRNKEMGRKMVVNANELKVIEIDLPGPDGKNHRLSETLRAGRPGIVVFTSQKDANTPGINVRLRELYDRRGGNISIYHVNVDGDRYAWKDGAVNLPWTSVYASAASDGKTLRDYNVSEVPTFFIYSPQGELINRAEDIEGLEAILGSY